MSKIGHNGGPHINGNNECETIDLEKGSKVWSSILEFIDEVSSATYNIIPPEVYYKEGDKKFFKLKQDTFVEFEIHSNRIQILAIITYIPENWFAGKSAA